MNCPHKRWLGRSVRFTAVALAVAVGVTLPGAEAQEYPPVALSGTELHQFAASHTEQTYQIQVALPDAYADTTRSFPVLYVLDADRSFGMATDIARWLAWAREMPQTIVVGIAYGEGREAWWQKRSRDYTQSPDDSRLWGDWPLAGGADAFADFFENELFRFVDGGYRTIPGDRTVIGISLGGLFCAHVLFTRPELFRRYVILAPALAWDYRRAFDEETIYATQHGALDAIVYTAVGELDDELRILVPWKEFVAQVEGRDYQDFSITAKVFEGETHISLFPVGMTQGLKAVFAVRPRGAGGPD